jgi:hypothetical protein
MTLLAVAECRLIGGALLEEVMTLAPGSGTTGYTWISRRNSIVSLTSFSKKSVRDI